ncbi:hypothetical protein ACQCN2_04635 [Brevibacillus ginsengisoli]|uniref:hypothetical protein n=1 Tax=Brevibacillus ginsengisoli TaxID=363854 RepID=UPI003CF6BD2B
MKVFVISLRNLIIGAVVGLFIIIGAIILVVKDPINVSSSFKPESSSIPTASPNPFESPKPSLSLDVQQDGSTAHVKLITQNFKFEQQGSSDSTNVTHGMGHAHLYIDGTLIKQVYSPEFILKKLPEGEHELKVELVYPNHMSYQVSQTRILSVN